MKLGFIGTGKITSSVVTGICRSNLSFNKIILSPRSKSVSQKLKKKIKTTKICYFAKKKSKLNIFSKKNLKLIK